MNVAMIGDGWWRTACQATGDGHQILPPPVEPPTNPHTADLNARAVIGPRWLEMLRQQPADLILDNGGAGLGFVPGPGGMADLKLAHESAQVPLASHWIDPLVTVFQALAWPVVWQSLMSDSWYKFFWDVPQADELRQFGVPNVHQLPMAALDREYNTQPLDPKESEIPVSFVGGQNTSYFYPQRQVPANSLLAGTLAHAVRADLSGASFFDIYYSLYRISDPPDHTEPIEARMQKALDYFNHKLFYNASLCIKQRDRFVIFLSRKLSDSFVLVGDRWDAAYGLKTQPPIPTVDGYLEHFRKSAINLNLVNGNSDSGLNMRHFEITAAGGFMLCYHQSEIDKYFDVGTECETFSNEQELLEKIQYYLAHPNQRVAIAHAGQQRTLKEHLYSHRLESIKKVIAPSSKSVPEGAAVEQLA